jgi:predicted alpha/beta-hydrolase family hydrolase
MMPPQETTLLSVAINDEVSVSGLLHRPVDAHACLVLAHGAGAGMNHPFLAEMARGLGQRGIASLRYQFPYMEQGKKRPDTPPQAHAAVRTAVAEAARLLPGLPLIAGGKSFGGRMTSQAQAVTPLTQIRGLVFIGFPLHPAGRPSDARGKHLFDVHVPMLFLQGTNDALAAMALLEPLCRALGPRATLVRLKDADHSFHVPARSGGKDGDIRNEIMDHVAAWIDRRITGSKQEA